MNKKTILMTAILLSVALIGLVFVNGASAAPEKEIKEKFGQDCVIKQTCDDMMFVDCDSAEDGPAYFLDKNLQVIGTSGGFCMTKCSGAPQRWVDCPTKKEAEK